MESTYPRLGGDPEFFIFERTDKKKVKVISADKILPGKNRKKTAINSDGKVFFDGVQAEINPNHQSCREYLGKNIRNCLMTIYNLAKKHYPESNIFFAPLGTININKEDLKGCDAECLKFGCSPDFNIYKRNRNFKYPNGKKYMKRFSGGHIHLGYGSTEYMDKMKNAKKYEEVIRMCDILAGITSVAISNGKEEAERRKYYGLAGTYRIQNHGVEYRTLSSFWTLSPPLMSLFTGLIRDAFTFSFRDKAHLFTDNIDDDTIQDVINNSKVKEAKRIFYRHIKPVYLNKGYKSSSYSRPGNSPIKPHTLRVIENMIRHGYRYYFEPDKMLHYWNIKRPYFVPDNWVTGYFGISDFQTCMRRRNRDYGKVVSKVKLIKNLEE